MTGFQLYIARYTMQNRDWATDTSSVLPIKSASAEQQGRKCAYPKSMMMGKCKRLHDRNFA